MSNWKKKKKKKRRNPTSPPHKKRHWRVWWHVCTPGGERWCTFSSEESVGDGRFGCAAFLKHVCLFERHKRFRSVLFVFFFLFLLRFSDDEKFNSLGFANRKKTKKDRIAMSNVCRKRFFHYCVFKLRFLSFALQFWWEKSFERGAGRVQNTHAASSFSFCFCRFGFQFHDVLKALKIVNCWSSSLFFIIIIIIIATEKVKQQLPPSSLLLRDSFYFLLVTTILSFDLHTTVKLVCNSYNSALNPFFFFFPILLFLWFAVCIFVCLFEFNLFFLVFVFNFFWFGFVLFCFSLLSSRYECMYVCYGVWIHYQTMRFLD